MTQIMHSDVDCKTMPGSLYMSEVPVHYEIYDVNTIGWHFERARIMCDRTFGYDTLRPKLDELKVLYRQLKRVQDSFK